MRLVIVILVALFPIETARASCEDQLATIEEHVKTHPKEGDTKQVQKNLENARALVEVDEIACLNAVARARHALALPARAPTPPLKGDGPERYQPIDPVQPLYQSPGRPKR
jgi:hypothetical protein